MGLCLEGGAEGTIRQKLLENGSIDGVIGLPSNVFFNTSIPTILMILRKDKTDRSVFFIDAKDEYGKSGTQNVLTEKNIDKIFTTYRERKDVDKFAHLATFEEIKENDFNLNIPRYVDTFEEEPEIPLNEVAREIKEIEERISENKKSLSNMLNQLVAADEESEADLKEFIELLGDSYE